MHADILYLCSPNNPTGAVATKAQLERWSRGPRARSGDPLRRRLRGYSPIPLCRTRSTRSRERARSRSSSGATRRRPASPVRLRFHGRAEGPPGTRRERRGRLAECALEPPPPTNSTASPTPCSARPPRLRRRGAKQTARSSVLHGQRTPDPTGLAAAGIQTYGGGNAPYIWLRTPGGLSSWDFFARLLREGTSSAPRARLRPSGEGYFRLSRSTRARTSRKRSRGWHESPGAHQARRAPAPRTPRRPGIRAGRRRHRARHPAFSESSSRATGRGHRLHDGCYSSEAFPRPWHPTFLRAGRRARVCGSAASRAALARPLLHHSRTALSPAPPVQSVPPHLYAGPIVFGRRGGAASRRRSRRRLVVPASHMYQALRGARRAGRPCVLVGGSTRGSLGLRPPMIHRAIRHADLYVAYPDSKRKHVCARADVEKVEVIGVRRPWPFGRIDPAAAKRALASATCRSSVSSSARRPQGRRHAPRGDARCVGAASRDAPPHRRLADGVRGEVEARGRGLRRGSAAQGAPPLRFEEAESRASSPRWTLSSTRPALSRSGSRSGGLGGRKPAWGAVAAPCPTSSATAGRLLVPFRDAGALAAAILGSSTTPSGRGSWA